VPSVQRDACLGHVGIAYLALILYDRA